MDLVKILEQTFSIQLDNNLRDYISNNISKLNFNKGFCPVKDGDVMNCFYFIITGLVRGFYIDEEGIEVTKCFSCEGQFFSCECFRTKDSSTFYVECIEDCCCIKIPYSIVQNIPVLIDKINYLYIQEVTYLERKVRNMLLMNANERYENFCHEYSTLKNRIPLKYVASYIGIEAASLSRIRHSKN